MHLCNNRWIFNYLYFTEIWVLHLFNFSNVFFVSSLNSKGNCGKFISILFFRYGKNLLPIIFLSLYLMTYVNRIILHLWTFKMPILVFIILVFSYLIFLNIFGLSIIIFKNRLKIGVLNVQRCKIKKHC
jgi:hypothetical protein